MKFMMIAKATEQAEAGQSRTTKRAPFGTEGPDRGTPERSGS